jgi:hypothetical protein
VENEVAVKSLALWDLFLTGLAVAGGFLFRGFWSTFLRKDEFERRMNKMLSKDDFDKYEERIHARLNDIAAKQK